MVKEVGLHEIAVALVMGGSQPRVLVQVHALHLGEVQIPGLVPLNELLVHADGRGARGQTQHTGRIEVHLGGDDVGRPAAHGLIVLCDVSSHDVFLLLLSQAAPECGAACG